LRTRTPHSAVAVCMQETVQKPGFFIQHSVSHGSV